MTLRLCCLAASDLARADVEDGGSYLIVQRQAGADGAATLKDDAERTSSRILLAMAVHFGSAYDGTAGSWSFINGSNRDVSS